MSDTAATEGAAIEVAETRANGVDHQQHEGGPNERAKLCRREIAELLHRHRCNMAVEYNTDRLQSGGGLMITAGIVIHGLE